MIWAKLSDIAGRKAILVTSMAIFTVFSALCGASQTINQLIMFRWCQGMGSYRVFAITQLLYMEMVPRRKLPSYFSLVTAVIAISLMIGPPSGGTITASGSWRWIFLMNYALTVRFGPCR